MVIKCRIFVGKFNVCSAQKKKNNYGNRKSGWVLIRFVPRFVDVHD